MTALAGHLELRCRCGTVVWLWPDARWVQCAGCARAYSLEAQVRCYAPSPEAQAVLAARDVGPQTATTR